LKKKTPHIALRVLALTLVLAILTPIITKSVHGCKDHEDEVCLNESTTHFHKSSIDDCELCKFKLSTQYVHVLKTIEFTEPKIYKVEVKSQYLFFNDFKTLQTTLRGPPSII